MADFTAVGTIIASIGGTLAAIAKDRSDRAKLEKDLVELKSQVAELFDGFAALKSKIRGQGSDAGLTELQKQIDDLHDRFDGFAKRLDDRDGQWLALQRELGGIAAKIEILLKG